MIGKCKLCGVKKELQKKSHIIPDFLYKDLFNEKHEITKIDFDSISTNKPLGYCQSGEYDQYILCPGCDNGILNSKYENYVKKYFLNGKDNLLVKETKRTETIDNGVLKIYDVDYSKFKLFWLSILWRSSISNRPNFKGVNLGKHEEIIRKMLYEENAKEDSIYPLLIYKHNTVNKAQNLIGPPFKGRMEGKTAYIFLIKDYFIFIFVNSINHKLSDWIRKYNIKETNELPLFYLDRKTSRSLFDKYIKQVKNNAIN